MSRHSSHALPVRALALLALLGAMACSRELTLPEAPKPPGPGTIYGRIAFAKPGRVELEPAKGALVSVLSSSLQVKADDDGRFLVDGVVASKGAMLVRYDGDGDGAFERQRIVRFESIGAGPGRQISVGELALGDNARVSGRVKLGDRADSSSGHLGTTVFVPQSPYLTQTADDGSWSLPQLPEGPVQIAVLRSGYAPALVDGIVLRSGEDLTLRELVLGPLTVEEEKGSISGRIVRLAPGGDGAVTVNAIDAEGGSFHATVEPDETFEIADVPVGVYRLVAAREGFVTAVIPNVAVTAGARTTLPSVLLSAGEDAPATCTDGVACQPDLPCREGRVQCLFGAPVCVATDTLVAAGASCGEDRVCGADGACVECAAGRACTPENACHTGAIACDSGAPVCADGGTPLPAGSPCGADQVCSPEGECAPCAAGASCIGDNPCHLGAVACGSGVAVCGDIGLLVPAGAACGEGRVCDPTGACVTCEGGGSCVPANRCRVGAVSCETGGPRCVDTGTPVAAGTSCGTDRVCDPAGACVACDEGASCVPDDPCHAGVIECGAGVPVCRDTGAALDAGTRCGEGRFCTASGACSACPEGSACQPADACRVGRVSCASGDAVCETTAQLRGAGTGCGEDRVCGADGACVACDEGAACSAEDPCHEGAIACASGEPVCVDTAVAVAPGRSCGNGRVCNPAGVCVACSAGASCTPANACKSGLIACDTGSPVCAEQDADRANGTTCGTDRVCNAGACVACAANVACEPANPCRRGATSCATGSSVCEDAGENQPDGTPCGTQKVCVTGSCVPSGLTIVSGDAQTGFTGQLVSPITFRYADALGAPQANVTITLAASGNAVVVPASGKTDIQGRFVTTLRLGTKPGTYTLAATTTGARADVTATANLPSEGTVFAIANPEHNPGADAGPLSALAARMNQPRFLASASDGTLYVSDYNNHVVYRITPEGILSVVAGVPGSYGYTGDGDLATKAKLDRPLGLALDEPAKLLYVADSANNRVRVVDLASGIIGHYAGGGTAPYPGFGDGGPAAAANLDRPGALGLGPDGALYVVESNRNRFRRIDRANTIIQTFWKPGSCYDGPQLMNCGSDLAGCHIGFDALGGAYVSGHFCDPSHTASTYWAIGKYLGEGKLALVAGRGTNGPLTGVPATATTLTGPLAFAFAPGGDLVIAERGAHRLRLVEAATTRVQMLAGTGTATFSGEFGAAASAGFNQPSSLAIGTDGTITLADMGNACLRRIAQGTKTTSPAAKLAIETGATSTVRLSEPTGALGVKLTDSSGAALQGYTVRLRALDEGAGVYANTALTTTGGLVSAFARPGMKAGPYRIQASFLDFYGRHASGSPATFTVNAVAPANGTIFTVLNTDHALLVDGAPGPASLAHVGWIRGTVLASDGTIYFADSWSSTVWKVSPAGHLTLVAGTPSTTGSGGDGGPGPQALLANPHGVVLSPDEGTLYIADTNTDRVRAVDLASGIISTYAGGGTAPSPGYGDGGPATSASLFDPNHVAIGPDGALYISDRMHGRIRRVDPASRIITTWFEGGTESCYDPLRFLGCGTSVASCQVTWDAEGNAYITGSVCGRGGPNSTATGVNSVVKRTPDGVVSFWSGRYQGSTAAGTPLANALYEDAPLLTHAPDGSIWIAENSKCRVRRYDPVAGTVSPWLGSTCGYSGDYVPFEQALIKGPWAIVRRPDGHLLLPDGENGALRLIW